MEESIKTNNFRESQCAEVDALSSEGFFDTSFSKEEEEATTTTFEIKSRISYLKKKSPIEKFDEDALDSLPVAKT